jgi:cell division protein FtsI (penicillin-binding protein 3)
VTEGEGTGVNAAIDGYQVAGKTATAQKADPETGLYSLDKFIASFVGFVPAMDPAVVIVVMLDEPMVEHAGGAVAAPVFRNVASMVLKYRGMTPQGTPRANPAELARRADPANAAYAAFREAEGKKPPVQDVEANARSEGQSARAGHDGVPRPLAIQKTLSREPEGRKAASPARQVPPPGQVVDLGAEITLVFEPST